MGPGPSCPSQVPVVCVSGFRDGSNPRGMGVVCGYKEGPQEPVGSERLGGTRGLSRLLDDTVSVVPVRPVTYSRAQCLGRLWVRQGRTVCGSGTTESQSWEGVGTGSHPRSSNKDVVGGTVRGTHGLLSNDPLSPRRVV